ncbi:conjugal transfer protein TraA [Planomonospora sphaerica]|uniref:Conjugal transfer protein TraA n=1 Tax=Planomonospora sphaerica TaxID=161355 RepID=A0A171DIY8_9ACTN|nr:MobF family relaxase [Planomonospora sphaerica]GAT68832.1 conjugal transfer protein TraA [Planomonospora sphaerica]
MSAIDQRLRTGEFPDDPVAPAELAASAVPVVPLGGAALRWIGSGLAEVGLTAGAPVTWDQHGMARDLMSGRDPRTGRQLVAPAMRTHPDAMLPAAPLLQVLVERAERHGLTVPDSLIGNQWAAQRALRLQRALERRGPGLRLPVDEARRLAAAAGTGLERLYDAQQIACALRERTRRVRIGNRGYELLFDLPKSISVLYGLADAPLAEQILDAFTIAVHDAVEALSGWAGYGLRGKNGEGHRARRMPGTGLLGWVRFGQTAHAVDGQVPDPHLHARVVIANMVRGQDGRWSAPGSGGRDVYRHALAADRVVKARLRRLLIERCGITWEVAPVTGAWEISRIPAHLRDRFSKRRNRVAAYLNEHGHDPATAETGARAAARLHTVEELTASAAPHRLRQAWRQQSRDLGVDPRALVAACLTGSRTPPPVPPADQLAAQVFAAPLDTDTDTDPSIWSRAQVLAAVIDALPGGLAAASDAEHLVRQVVNCPGVVALPTAAASTLTNHERYTVAF